MRGEARLRSALQALAIPFAEHEHEAVFTVEESRRIDAGFPGRHTKNLFLKDTAGAFWLVTVPAEARVDLKALPAAIGCKRVSFGKAEDMERLIGISPGSVTPLAMINAAPGSVTVVVEDGLASAERVNVTRCATLARWAWRERISCACCGTGATRPWWPPFRSRTRALATARKGRTRRASWRPDRRAACRRQRTSAAGW